MRVVRRAPDAVCWTAPADTLVRTMPRGPGVARPREIRILEMRFSLRYRRTKQVDGTVVVPAQTLVRSSWYRV